MKYLLDTHFLIWIPVADRRVPASLLSLLSDADNEFIFSTASLWEIAIKHAAGRADFPYEARGIRTRLINAGYEELPVLGEHALAVESLDAIHKDPFDRLLIAQAMVEGITLLTVDAEIARYPGPIRKV
jgi:PIN domain nuclease of toxin-antitoxin system